MPTQCYSVVRSCVARLTKTDACGRPVPPGTPCAYAVTKGYVTISFEPEISEGEEIELRNACGEICVSDKPCDDLKWLNVSVEFCVVDPDVINLITGYETVLDWAGNAVGNRIQRHISCDEGFALETWSKLPAKQCSPDAAEGEWGYFLLPWMVGGTIGEFELGNDATTFTYTSHTKEGSLWGVGPWDVDQQDAAGTAGQLLTPIGPEDHMDQHVVTIAPPEPTCGCQPMPDYSIDSPDELSLAGLAA